MSEYTPLLNGTRSRLTSLLLQSRKVPQRRGTTADCESRLDDLGPNQFKPISVFHMGIFAQLALTVLPAFTARIFGAHPWLCVCSAVSSVVSGLIPTAGAYVASLLLDEVQRSLLDRSAVDVRAITVLSGVVVLMSGLDVLMRFGGQLSTTALSRAVKLDTAITLHKATLALDMPAMQEPYRRDTLEAANIFAGTGQAIDRQGNLTTGVSSSKFVDAVNTIISALVTLLSSFSLLISTVFKPSTSPEAGSSDQNVQLLLVSIAMLPALVGLLATLTTDENARKFNYITWRRRQNLESLIQLEHRKEVVLFDLADWLLSEWQKAVTAITLERPLMGAWRWAVQLSSTVGTTTVNTIFQVLLALQIFPSSITLGSAQLLQSIAAQFIKSLEAVYTVMESTYQTVFFLAAFIEATTLQSLIVARGPDGEILPPDQIVKYKSMVGPDGARGMKILARNLSFRYPGASKYALKDVNLVLWPGQTLAIVGFNGGGKTTLLTILMRLVDYEGELYINDIDARMYEPADLHKHMTASFQEYSKYPVTLKENILVGDRTLASNDPALQAAIAAGSVDDFLFDLPNGLETQLNKNPEAPRKANKQKLKQQKCHPETSISGGEWRRVSLARAFLKVPKSDFCIFDEPSDSLDARTSHKIFQRIAKLSRNDLGQKIRSTVFVTHHFATVKQADVIAVFENGTISEFGTHNDLMKIERGTYSEFYTLQSQAFVD